MIATTIVFTAHNRRDMLLDAVALAKAQTVPAAIVVVDDASTDGTAEALAAAHPDVPCHRSPTSRGPCHQRNRGVALAATEIVFLLDDDSMLVDPRTVEQSLADLAEAPDAAVLAIPFRNILRDATVHHARRDAGQREVAMGFAACAHAVRRDAFLAVGGYDERFFYMVEEPDLTLRLLDAGRFVELGTAPPIDHLQPPDRRSERAVFYGRRNHLLMYGWRVAGWRRPVWLAGTAVKSLIWGARHRHWRSTFAGLAAGWRDLRAHPATPVRATTFALFQRLKRRSDALRPDAVRALLR